MVDLKPIKGDVASNVAVCLLEKLQRSLKRCFIRVESPDAMFLVI